MKRLLILVLRNWAGYKGINMSEEDLAWQTIERLGMVPDGGHINNWMPTGSIEHAMKLWRKFPPKNQWLLLQLGEDGWTVELMWHNEEYRTKFIMDDDQNSLPYAITKAWLVAMENLNSNQNGGSL